MNKPWAASWEVFANYIAELWLGGARDSELTEAVGGARVRWRGVVKTLMLDSEYSPGAELDMLPRVEVPLRDGKTLEAEHVAVNVGKATVKSWRSVRPGDTVEFEGCVSKGGGPFPGVEVVESELDDVATLLMMIEDAKIV